MYPGGCHGRASEPALLYHARFPRAPCPAENARELPSPRLRTGYSSQFAPLGPLFPWLASPPRDAGTWRIRVLRRCDGRVCRSLHHDQVRDRGGQRLLALRGGVCVASPTQAPAQRVKGVCTGIVACPVTHVVPRNESYCDAPRSPMENSALGGWVNEAGAAAPGAAASLLISMRRQRYNRGRAGVSISANISY